jgi:predicted TIM-barrel fold metal-dependent hydrolase
VSLAGVDAYNEFAQEEFAAADRTRIFPMYQIPSLGIDTAVKYVKKAKQAGARGVLIGTWPNGGDGISDEDDKFWAACVENGMPVHVHIMLESRDALLKQQSGAQSATTGLQAIAARKRAIAQYAGVFTRVTPIISQFAFSGVFDRYPELQIVFVEIGVGWLPHFLEMMDDRYWRNRNWVGFDMKRPPSYYWHSNMAATFMHDYSGIALRHAVGVNNMMWSSDNPHHGNDWPYARKVIAEMMHTVDPIERYQLVAGNAARIYRLDAMRPETAGGAVRVVARKATASRNGRNGKTATRRAPARAASRNGRNGKTATRKPARARTRR